MRQIRKLIQGKLVEAHDELAIEEPLEIRAGGRAVSITMRTPGHDDELAAGFFFTEGIVTGAGDIARIEKADELNTVNVSLRPDLRVDFERLTRHVFAASSCGICGKTTIDSIHASFGPVQSDAQVSIDVFHRLPDAMRAAQPMFEQTGGLHAAAVFDVDGNLLIAREDVGRHNAVDKCIGRALLDRKLPLDRHILLVSGRASFEIMQKALAARIPIVAAVSAPSSLAVEFAIDSRQTLVGFLRDDRMNIYTHPDRIKR